MTRKLVLHATLRIELEQTFYIELTDGGVRVIPDAPLFLPEEIVYSVKVYEGDLTGMLSRVEDEIKKETKVSWLDLLKLALGLQPRGFSCLSFAYYIWTGKINNKLTVEELIDESQRLRTGNGDGTP